MTGYDYEICPEFWNKQTNISGFIQPVGIRKVYGQNTQNLLRLRLKKHVFRKNIQIDTFILHTAH